MVFVLDNYDSFTYNLVQYLGELGAEVVVRRNDEVSPEDVVAFGPERILLSPGPCTPQDAGILIPLIEHLAARPAEEQIPVLAPHLMHGKTSLVDHDGQTIFYGLPQPLTCTRYHSLIVEEGSVPAELEVSARVAGEGTIMALRHRSLPMEGVQFHPESVLTESGKQLIANFLGR